MGHFHLSNFIALIGILLVGPTATSGAAVSVVSQADSNDICSKYVVQAGETCSAIAQAHSITTADIETYNAQSWAWTGCGQISQGDFICLSSGESPMPVALPHAVCGPQVPGTARPNTWSKLGSLNPCPANQCCSSSGLCGTTPDFCTSAAHVPVALSMSTDTQPNQLTTTSQAITISTSPAIPLQKVVTSSETSSSMTTSTSATTSVPTTTSTTTTTKTTSTLKTTTTSTISSQTKTKTSTSTSTTKPKIVKPWSLTMYTKQDCKGDYYVLQGHNKGYSDTCLNLHGGLSSKDTDTGVSCKWFTNDGKSSTKCDSGALTRPQSWIVETGICTVFSVKDCKHDLHSNAYTPVPKHPCQNRGKFDTPYFVSMNCYTEG
ncbi:Peptidoglycan-binding Lysin subgroup [Penicillium expansum]|uniref:Secreted LysM effector LysM9 n=1 Tax=Penicillium expansum TaxID=27334 RepID=LYSM9_PENEN|nr:Peptidoglycan-binding Lysin subgroup [Penicillium expansum]KGO36402.1 Peptidoglycan-binding Lysin subgroup [Penicillium expansum]KGO50900.1 Peptidoglycan-binding Lysin subgroup [Penicillium expansum]KGO54652.1 Peptidoglycan-binding Lysin subgroup [Penicillium expansum]